MSRTVIQPWTGDLPCDTDELTPEQIEMVRTSAAAYLWALSGRRVGALTTVEEGFRTACSDGCAGMPYKGSDGEWRNSSGSPSECCRIELFRQPVRKINEVRLWGDVLDPSGYTIEGNSLLRIGDCWPCCDDCDVPCIEVDYESGVVPDGLAVAALGELSCEFVNAATGKLCKLPSRATSVSRQGVTIDLADAESFAENGLTGLPVVDAFIRTFNPSKLVHRSRVLSPDLARSTR